MLGEDETCIKSRNEAIVLCNTFIQLAGQNCCPFLQEIWRQCMRPSASNPQCDSL